MPSHDHPEGLQGAQAIAAAVHAGRNGATKAQIAEVIAGFGFDCAPTLDQQHALGWVGVTCRETVPAATVAFLESTDFEDAVRNAVFLGGDTDTTACITGAIAEAYYGGVPPAIEAAVRDLLDATLLDVVDRFRARFITKRSMPGRRRGGVRGTSHEPQTRSRHSGNGDGVMSAPNFRDWLKEGERELQAEARERNASDEIEWPSNDDEKARDGDTSRVEEPPFSRYADAAGAVIGRYVVACGMATPLDLPTRHEWRATQDSGWLPMEAGVVTVARRVAALFGCGCTWATPRSGYGMLEFRGYDDNPAHAIGAMKALVEDAVTTAIKRRPGELVSTDSVFLLRLGHFVGGYCAAVAEKLGVFLEERAQAWENNDGKMHLLIYASGQVAEPSVSGPPPDDEAYRNGVAFGSGRA